MDTKINEKVRIQIILKAIDPLLKIENCYGIFRFYLMGDHLVRTNRKMKVFGISLMSVLVILFFIYLVHISHTIKVFDIAAIVLLVDIMPLVVVAVQYCISTIILLQLSDKNIELIKTLAKIDHILNISVNSNHFKKLRKNVIFILFVFLLSYIISSIPTFIIQVEDNDISYEILYFTIDFPRHLEFISFYILIKILSERLDTLNKYLLNFIKFRDEETCFLLINNIEFNEDFEYNKSLNFVGRISSKNKKIIRLAAAYEGIAKANNLINKIFEFQNFITLVSTFIYIIITLWTSIYYYRTSKYSKTFLTIIVQCIYEILIIAIMSYVCDSMTSKRSETKLYMNMLIMDYNLPEPMRNQAKVFVELIEVWSLEIFAYMFPIDIKLILKFISVSTAYLIVIIQITHFL